MHSHHTGPPHRAPEQPQPAGRDPWVDVYLGDKWRVPPQTLGLPDSGVEIYATIRGGILLDRTAVAYATTTMGGTTISLAADVRDPRVAPTLAPWVFQQNGTTPTLAFGAKATAQEMRNLRLNVLLECLHPTGEETPADATTRLEAGLAMLRTAATPEPTPAEVWTWMQAKVSGHQKERKLKEKLDELLSAALIDLDATRAMNLDLARAARESLHHQSEVGRLQAALDDARAERDAVTRKLREMEGPRPATHADAEIVPDDLLKALLLYVHPDARPNDPKALELTRQINALRDQIKSRRQRDTGAGAHDYGPGTGWYDIFGRRR